MTTLQSGKQEEQVTKKNLYTDFTWFYDNFYHDVEKYMNEFFEKEFMLRFLGFSNDENILFYGDEYFVNKISMNKSADFKIKISSSVISSMLNNALGFDKKRFELQNLTDIEAMLIKSFTVYMYKQLEPKFNKEEPSKQILKNSKEYNFTFFVQIGEKHVGKLIISLPDYSISDVNGIKPVDRFSITDFKSTNALVTISVGSSKIALNEIKMLEDGDIIVLENSDINKMAVTCEGENIDFKINPNPSLIMNIDDNGGNEMEDGTSLNSQNMWDSILVDIVAEFDNVKLTLGDLKQISEGLVVDVGSVYNSKIKLRVENQVVAVGELVIINDRYGVRIDSIKKNQEMIKTEAAATPSTKQTNATKQVRPSTKSATKQAPNATKGDENFDYSDFEIEDESI